MTVELDEDVEPCPQCTHPSKEYPGTKVTMGCKVCNYTGHKNTWSIVGEHRGGHYHCRVWVGPPVGRALLGHLIMSEQNWVELALQVRGNPLWNMTEQIV